MEQGNINNVSGVLGPTIRERIESLMVSTESDTAKLALEKFSELVKAQSEMTVGELRKSREDLRSLKDTIGQSAGITDRDRANILNLLNSQEMTVDNNTTLAKRVTGTIKDFASNNAVDITSVAAGVFGRSPLMMLGTKFVGDKIKEGRENRKLKREEQERTREALEQQARLTEEEFSILRNRISDEEIIQKRNLDNQDLQNKTEEERRKILDEEKNNYIRESRIQKEEQENLDQIKQKEDEIASRFGLDLPEVTPIPNNTDSNDTFNTENVSGDTSNTENINNVSGDTNNTENINNVSGDTTNESNISNVSTQTAEESEKITPALENINNSIKKIETIILEGSQGDLAKLENERETNRLENEKVEISRETNELLKDQLSTLKENEKNTETMMDSSEGGDGLSALAGGALGGRLGKLRGVAQKAGTIGRGVLTAGAGILGGAKSLFSRAAGAAGGAGRAATQSAGGVISRSKSVLSDSVKRSSNILSSSREKISNFRQSATRSLDRTRGSVARRGRGAISSASNIGRSAVGGIRRAAGGLGGRLSSIAGAVRSPRMMAGGIASMIPSMSGGSSPSTVSSGVAKGGAKKGGLLGKVSSMGGGKLGKLGKIGGKGLGKSLLKKIPGVGAIAGLGLAAGRLAKGDGLGALGEAASGIASIVPGLGTAVSTAIDGAMIARDMRSASGEESSNLENLSAGDSQIPNINSPTVENKLRATEAIKESTITKEASKIKSAGNQEPTSQTANINAPNINNNTNNTIIKPIQPYNEEKTFKKLSDNMRASGYY